MNLKVGDTFSKSREVTDELIKQFADISGDYNPIHLNEEFAAETQFGRRIAHGMLSGAFISGVLGYGFSVRKVVYLSQTLRFVAPVFIGDTVTVYATVSRVREDKPIVTIETVCENQNGEKLVKGEAVLMILE